MAAKTDREVIFKALADAQEMVSDAISIAENALDENPTREQRRVLDEEILELNAKFSKLQGRLLAMAKGKSVIARPTDPQLAALTKLSEEVDSLAHTSVSASEALTTIALVLDTVRDTGLV